MKLIQLCLLVPVWPVLGQTVVSTPSIPPPTPPPIIRRDKSAKKAAPDFQIETTLYSIGQPTDEEQLYLELINRARANPTAEGIRLATTSDPDVLYDISHYGVNLDLMKSEFAALPVRPPLAMNAMLTTAARLHTQVQFDTASQTHQAPGELALGDRLQAASYDFSVYGENVFAYAKNTFYGHVGFQIDWGPDSPDDGDGMQAGRGHRMNIHGNFREVGIGILFGTNTIGANTVGPQLVTQDFGTSQADDTLVTGVAYYDSNGNNFYDPGEGIGGLTVNVNGSSFHAVTANSGGYAVPVPAADATRTVTFSGLNANADQSAVISGAANVKVDFKPVYVPPALSGPVNPVVSSPADYTFNSVIGATGYEGRYATNVNATTDAAEDLSRVTVIKTGNYETLSTVKDSGNKAYHLATPGAGLQTITYNSPFLVKDAAGSLSFRSRLGIANTTQIARVQVSTNGGIVWSDVFSQAGTGQPGETTFQTRNVSLAAYAGKDIQLRFNYTLSGSFYNGTGDGFGWYIDNVAFTNMVDLSAATTTTLLAGNTFSFTPPALGDFILSVGPLISGRNFGFGTPKSVTAVSSPPTLAEIEVEKPGGTPLVDGTSSVGFTTQFLGTPQTLTFTIRNVGIEDLTGLSVSTVGTHAADFVAGSPAVAVLAQNATTTFDVTFTPSAKGVRTATLRVFSNDSNENPFDINLTGTGKNAPEIDVQPLPLVKVLGAPASFTVHATHPQPAQIHYQWRKNGVAISGATTDTLNLSSVKTTDATGYSVLVSVGTDTTLSNIVQLAVVTPVTQSLALKEKTAATFTVTVAGSGYNLVWKKSTGSPPVIETLLGKTAKSLALTNLNPLTDTAIYTCEAQMPGSIAVAGTFNLSVFNAKPQITQTQAMPDGRISSSYTHQIKFDSSPLLAPTTFSAAPLPLGLKLDAKTGLITGKPTLAKPSYTITLTATNSLGSTSTTDAILIVTLPAGVDGVYTGTVEREADLNLGLGGRIDLTITTTGTISGTLALGAIKFPFTGVMDISVDEPPAPPEATVIIKRTGTLLPLTLKFTLDTAGNRFATSSVSAGAHTAAIEAWRLVWKATGIPLNLATPLPKLFTFALKPPALPATMPRGDGYGSFTLGKDGKLSITGKVADGETYTCSSFAGPLGEIPLFQTLYVPNGSLHGKLDIDLADTGNLNSNILGGTVSWMRPANPLKTALVYKSGFGPATLTAVGALFTPPGATLILGLVTPDVDKARFVFADGGLGSSATSPNILFDIGAGNKIKIPTTIAANPGLVKLTSISLTTGLFSGSFTLQDNDPRAAFAGKKVTRTATFNGILTNDGTHPIGAGHFLLPELPSDADPLAVPPIPATTPTTSKKLSGSVLMEKKD